MSPVHGLIIVFAFVHQFEQESIVSDVEFGESVMCCPEKTDIRAFAQIQGRNSIVLDL